MATELAPESEEEAPELDVNDLLAEANQEDRSRT